MKVFVSWSGDRGHHLAGILCEWLPMVLPGTEPWMSTRLKRGTNWTVELLDTLREARACLVCVTADSLESTWEFFEAGMLFGSGHDPVLIRCLCLDIPALAISRGPLAPIPALRLECDDVLTLLRDINGVLSDPLPDIEIEARYEQARDFLNARLAALPEARGRVIEVVVQTPQGLCPIAATANGDTEWVIFIESIRQDASKLISSPVADLASYRCLDVGSKNWIETPVVVGQLKAKRIALVPPEADENAESHSARYTAYMLHESLEVQPARRAAHASIERDLKDLVTLQTEFHNKNGRYANHNELDFCPGPGTSIELRSTDNGFHAVASRGDFPTPLAVRLGDGAGKFDDKLEGSPFIPDFEPSRFWLLKSPRSAGPAAGECALELDALPEPMTGGTFKIGW